jgi:hypothetical protein
MDEHTVSSAIAVPMHLMDERTVSSAICSCLVLLSYNIDGRVSTSFPSSAILISATDRPSRPPPEMLRSSYIFIWG